MNVSKKSIGIIVFIIAIFIGSLFVQPDISLAQSTPSPSPSPTVSPEPSPDDPVNNNPGELQAIFNGISGTTIPVIGLQIKLVLYLVLMFVTGLIYLMGYLISAALEFNISLLNFDPPFIISGWQIFRDIANLGFVLGIIVIGVATILRIKSYRAQSILWKLIVAALLVNFSLVIAGVFIEVSHSVSNYILSYIGAGGSNDIGTGITRIGDSFRFFEVANNVAGWGGGFWSDVGNMALDAVGGSGASLGVLVSLAILILFAAVVFVTLLSFFALLFLRYFYLAFLLIISPIVWLLWVFPNTQDHWRKWWKMFINWVLYAPLVLFFVYISLAVIDRYAQYSQQVQTKFSIIFSAEDGAVDFGLIMSTLIAVALLIGGMKIARSMGEGGANLAFSFGDKVSDWAKSKAKTAGRNATARAGRGVAASKLGKATQSKLASWSKFKTVKDLKEERDAKIKEGKPLSANASYGAKYIGKAMGTVGFGALGSMKRKVASEAALGIKGIEKRSEKTLADQSSKRVKDITPEDAKQVFEAFNQDEKIQLLSNFAKDGKITKSDADKMLGEKGLHDLLVYGKAKGKQKEVSDIEKSLLVNEDMLKASLKAKSLEGKAKTDAQAEYDAAAKKFLGGLSEKDWKNVDKGIIKKILSSDLKDFTLGGEEEAKTLQNIIKDFSGELFKGTLHGISSRLDDEDLRSYYKDVIKHVVEKNDPKIKSEIQRFLEDDKFDEAVKILRESNVSKVSNFAKKFSKIVGSRIGGLEEDDKKEKDKEEKTFKMKPGFDPNE